MVVGAGTSLLGWGGSPYIYSIGAVGFVSMQLQQRYEGTNFTIRRAFVLKCANFFLFFNISLYFCRTKLIIYE